MRKGRLLFWGISLILCVILLFIQKKIESIIPYEERTVMNVYCLEEFQEKIKEIIEESSIGDDHRVVFTDNKAEAEFILTDRVTASDNGYEKLGWTPLIVAFDDTTKDKLESYEKEGYLSKVKSDNSYQIDFEKIIEDTIRGTWKDKIYCPDPKTKEGKLFFDFLLINTNDGKYPSNEEEMNKCTQVANQFLNSSVVIQMDCLERLKNKKIVEEELYIIFEKDIYDMNNASYKFEISYPTNTVTYEYYYFLQGSNQSQLEKILNKEKFNEHGNRLQHQMYINNVRNSAHNSVYTTDYYKESDGFSYVAIPLKEE